MSSEDKYKQRYYYKESYEVAIVTFATAIILLFVAILSLLFRIYDIEFLELADWGVWLFIPVFFMFIVGFQQLYRNMKYNQVVKNALVQRNFQGSHNLENMALEIGMKSKDILPVLVDLRNKGLIKYNFDAESGKINIEQPISNSLAPEYVAPIKKLDTSLPSGEKSYCEHCGYNAVVLVNYCPNCGSKL